MMKIIRFFLLSILIGLVNSCDEGTENYSNRFPLTIPNDATMEYPLGPVEEYIFTRITQEPAHASLSQTVNAGGRMIYYYKAMEDFTGMDYVGITFYTRNNDGSFYVTQFLQLDISVTEPND